jgi:hypothetical protein
LRAVFGGHAGDEFIFERPIDEALERYGNLGSVAAVSAIQEADIDGAGIFSPAITVTPNRALHWVHRSARLHIAADGRIVMRAPWQPIPYPVGVAGSAVPTTLCGLGFGYHAKEKATAKLGIEMSASNCVGDRG